jgi:hypothetical protein
MEIRMTTAASRTTPLLKPGSRRRSPLDSEAEAALRRFIAENHPTTDQAIDWLLEHYEIRYSPTGIRNVLHRIDCHMPYGHLRGSGRAQQWHVLPTAAEKAAEARRTKAERQRAARLWR